MEKLTACKKNECYKQRAGNSKKAEKECQRSQALRTPHEESPILAPRETGNNWGLWSLWIWQLQFTKTDERKMTKKVRTQYPTNLPLAMKCIISRLEVAGGCGSMGGKNQAIWSSKHWGGLKHPSSVVAHKNKCLKEGLPQPWWAPCLRGTEIKSASEQRRQWRNWSVNK